MPKGRTERIFLKAALWLLILFLLFVAVFLSGAAWELRQKEQIARHEREYAKSRYEEVLARHDFLTEKLGDLSTDRGLEEEFRERFPVAREGEEVIVLIDTPQKGDKADGEPHSTLWQWFKDRFGL